MKSRFLFILFLVFASILQAQVITTDPAFPKVDEMVTITFHAAEGNGALAGFTGDVYAHTGVITNLSTSPSDWKYVKSAWATTNPAVLMTKTATDTYQISYNIKAYYGVPDGEQVLKMAFVFRNATGSIVGRDTDGSDIFVDVFESNAELITNFIRPAGGNIIVNVGEMIEVEAASSLSAALSLTDNGIEIATANGTSLTHTITANEMGDHQVTITANDGNTTAASSFSYYVLDANPADAAAPEGTKDGLNRTSSSSIVLQLRAPGKSHVFVLGSFNDWQISGDYLMTRTPDQEAFWLQIDGLDPAEVYSYQYLVDGSIQIADPYSELILDPFNDKDIPSATFPNLPPYPTGKTTGNVSVFQTTPPAFSWTDNGFQKPANEELVVYELLMRDFLGRSDYQTLLDTLNYLDRLGINAIELMPVNEFEANNSWGYNPSFHMALDKYYGSPEAFKTFIDEAHARGIAVILDVVFNHAFSQSPLAQLYWNSQNFEPAANNPWLNVQPTHPFNVGYDFNHESTYTKRFVKQVLQYWLEEYHIDGFRFDLSKGFTQVNNLNDVGAWSAYDASRIAILKDYADHLWSVDEDAYVILEHLGANNEEKELAEYGMMLWGNMNHDYNEASMGYSSNLSWTDYRNRSWNVPYVMGYMESHDEERLMYKNLQFGNAAGDYSVKNLKTALRRQALVSAFFYTIPGPKMLWQFGELGYDYSINQCEGGMINNNCRLDRKPIRWDYNQDSDRRRLYEITRALIHFKTAYPVTNTTDYSLDLTGTNKRIHLNHATFNTVVLGNFGVTSTSISPNFQSTGWWYDYFTGDSIMVENVAAAIALAPGEYKLYTSQKLAFTQDILNSEEDVLLPISEVALFPNPTEGEAILQFYLEKNTRVQVQVYAANGAWIQTLWQQPLPSGQHAIPLKKQAAPGLYFIQITTPEGQLTKKWVVLE
ncbi:MAG: alpha-amylase family glycosyl hydrolase [Saprospiraceae bacterium]